jgi:hypothetical protein
MRFAALTLAALLLLTLAPPRHRRDRRRRVGRGVTLKEVNEAIANMPHIGRGNLLSASQMKEFIENLHRPPWSASSREARRPMRESPEGGMVRTSLMSAPLPLVDRSSSPTPRSRPR